MTSLLIKRLTKSMATICFEGNIGSGKSSALNHLCQKYDKVMTIPEPLDKWQDLNGHNLIDMLYKDINRYSFAFEHFAQLTRLQTYADSHTTHANKRFRLMERSIYSARHCFTENLYQSGNLSKAEYIVIDEWFKWLSAKPCFEVDLIVYLRTDPQTAYQRIKNRSRSGETDIPIDYLKCLHELHDKWLLGKEKGIDAKNVVTIDANLDQKEMFSLLERNLEPIIKQFS